MSGLPAGVVEQLRTRYRLQVDGAAPLTGGYDVWADSWWLDSDLGPLVLRADRGVSTDTGQWLGDVQRRAARAGVPCCPPLAACDGTMAFRSGDATMTVRAFAEGADLDRNDAASIRAAGTTLALVHRCGEGMTAGRPTPSPWHSSFWPGTDDPPGLCDPELDSWHHAFAGGTLASGLVHGDFYAENIVWADGRVAAVLDWSEAGLDLLARELAWATWEFGHDDDYELDIDRARTFLDGYREVREPQEPGLSDVLIALMRVELRRNARYALVGDDPEYSTVLQRAFRRLRRQSATSLLEP